MQFTFILNERTRSQNTNIIKIKEAATGQPAGKVTLGEYITNTKPVIFNRFAGAYHSCHLGAEGGIQHGQDVI